MWFKRSQNEASRAKTCENHHFSALCSKGAQNELIPQKYLFFSGNIPPLSDLKSATHCLFFWITFQNSWDESVPQFSPPFPLPEKTKCIDNVSCGWRLIVPNPLCLHCFPLHNYCKEKYTNIFLKKSWKKNSVLKKTAFFYLNFKKLDARARSRPGAETGR